MASTVDHRIIFYNVLHQALLVQFIHNNIIAYIGYNNDVPITYLFVYKTGYPIIVERITYS